MTFSSEVDTNGAFTTYRPSPQISAGTGQNCQMSRTLTSLWPRQRIRCRQADVSCPIVQLVWPRQGGSENGRETRQHLQVQHAVISVGEDIPIQSIKTGVPATSRCSYGLIPKFAQQSTIARRLRCEFEFFSFSFSAVLPLPKLN